MSFFDNSDFKKWCWIELIGFDNTSKDYGVSNFISRAGFKPTGISLLISWLGFVFEHESLDIEKKLNNGECSYVGHCSCPERKRQPWTNFELKGLVDELHRNGIQVYISFFNYCSYAEDNGNIFIDPFHEAHPEVREKDSSGTYISTHMLKRLSDGTYYEDVLQEKTVNALVDYGFDGIQIADGISSPRLTVPSSICRDDILLQFEERTGIKIPEYTDVKEYVKKNCYIEYVNFCAERWTEFFKKFYNRLSNAGKTAHFNSAWTTCAIDSIYRYGVDYRGVAKAGATSCVIEDVSGAVGVLAKEYNGFLMTDEERRRIHYWFLAKLMINRATLKDVELFPIANIHDNMEQWGVYEHMRTYMTTSTASNLNNIIYTQNGIKPLIDGPLYCLCDSLKSSDWDYIRNVWNTAYTKDAYGNAGVTLVWDDTIIDAELRELNENRRATTTHILTELLYGGAPVNAVVRTDDIKYMPKPFGVYSGALLVINPDLLSADKFNEIKASGKDIFIITLPNRVPKGFNILVEEKNSFGGIVLASNKNGDSTTVNNGADYAFDSKTDDEPLNGLWTHTLAHKPYSNDFWIECGNTVQKLSGAPSIDRELVTEHGVHRRVCKYICIQTRDENKCRIILINDDYWYNLPNVTFNKNIKGAKCVTKYDGYEVHMSDKSVCTLVPLRAAEIIDVEFE